MFRNCPTPADADRSFSSHQVVQTTATRLSYLAYASRPCHEAIGATRTRHSRGAGEQSRSVCLNGQRDLIAARWSHCRVGFMLVQVPLHRLCEAAMWVVGSLGEAWV